MSIALVVPTHNRLEYTQKVIPRLLEDRKEEFDLYLWDNASTDDTAKYLKSLNDPRIAGVHISKTNEGQVGAMNWTWSKTSAELVGKLDNDCLVTPGWTRTFAQAHRDIPELGAVGMWHFFEEDFNYERARHKIQQFNGHRIFRHPWVAGSGFIMKRQTFLKQGPWTEGQLVGTTGYFKKMALAGYINGWYYPLIHQEHMDDPRSKHSRFHRMSFDEAYKDSFGYQNGLIDDYLTYQRLHKDILDNLLSGPYDPKYYCGFRNKIKKVLEKSRKLFNLK